MSRRIYGLALLSACLLSVAEAHAFGLADVTARAEKLAAAAYQKPGSSLSKALESLTYDRFRDIRYRPDLALWRNPRLPFEYGYRILWEKDRETRPPVGWVRETRRGRGYAKTNDGSLELHVDFEGPTLARLPASAPLEAAVCFDNNGEVLERHLRRNEVTGGWRSVVRFRRLDCAKPTELRTHLTSGPDLLSEIWSYILPPE